MHTRDRPAFLLTERGFACKCKLCVSYEGQSDPQHASAMSSLSLMNSMTVTSVTIELHQNSAQIFHACLNVITTFLHPAHIDIDYMKLSLALTGLNDMMGSYKLQCIAIESWHKYNQHWPQLTPKQCLYLVKRRYAGGDENT